MRRVDDALELVLWYEKQQHHATKLTDNEIALALGWTRGGTQHHGGLSSHKGAVQPYGDAGRVRKARQYVDHDTRDLFAEYHFGTRENGYGCSFSRLRRLDDGDVTGLVAHVVAQVGRAVQEERQHRSELDARILPMFRLAMDDLRAEPPSVANTELLMALNDVIRDLEEKGRITSSSQYRLIKAGVPT